MTEYSHDPAYKTPIQFVKESLGTPTRIAY